MAIGKDYHKAVVSKQGKGDVDRTKNRKAAEETWERIFGKGKKDGIKSNRKR